MKSTRPALLIDPEHITLPAKIPTFLKDVLLKEKEYVDSQISANLAANLTIIGVVITAVVTGIGWVLSSATPANAAFVSTSLFVLTTISAIGAMVSSIFNGFAFGYIAYKALYLDPLIRRLLNLEFNPLVTSAFISTMPSRVPIILSTLGSSLIQLVLNWSLFWWAINKRSEAVASATVVPNSGIFLVGITLLVASASTFSTMWSLLSTRTATIRAATRPYHRGAAAADHGR